MVRFLALVALLALCGCGSPAEDFAGTYAVTGASAITITTPSSRTSSGAITDTSNGVPFAGTYSYRASGPRR